MSLSQPAPVIAVDLIAVIGAQVDVIKSVERPLQTKRRIAPPILRPLVIVGPALTVILHRLFQRIRRFITPVEIAPGFRVLADVADVLQV